MEIIDHPENPQRCQIKGAKQAVENIVFQLDFSPDTLPFSLSGATRGILSLGF